MCKYPLSLRPLTEFNTLFVYCVNARNVSMFKNVTHSWTLDKPIVPMSTCNLKLLDLDGNYMEYC